MPSGGGIAVPLLAGALVATASGCATSQRCRVTPWLELEYAHRVNLFPGIAYGEGNVRVMVRSNGTFVEAERRSALSCHVLPDAVLLLVLEGPGGRAREGHVYRPGQSALQLVDLTSCARPLVLAERSALLCWSCAREQTQAQGSGCSFATFSEIALDGAVRWERLLPLPVSLAGEPCRIEEIHGLSAAGDPVVRLACPAPEATRRIEPWARVDVELRSDGFTELEPAAVPRTSTSLPQLDPRCPR